MKKTVAWALVNRKGSIALLDAQLPIYWLKKVALAHASTNGMTVVKVQIQDFEQWVGVLGVLTEKKLLPKCPHTLKGWHDFREVVATRGDGYRADMSMKMCVKCKMFEDGTKSPPPFGYYAEK